MQNRERSAPAAVPTMAHPGPRSLRLAEVVYRTVLRVYPAPFRRRFGTEVVEAFRDSCRVAHRMGRGAFLTHVLHAIGELLVEGFRERWAPIGPPYSTGSSWRAGSPGPTGARRPAGSPAPTGAHDRTGLLGPTGSPPRSPRRGSMIERLLHDVRCAARTLRRAPAFTMVVVATLGLGIGANTAIFSVIDGVLLRPLPYEDPEDLVSFSTRLRGRGGSTLSEPELIDLRTQTESYRGVGAIDWTTLAVGGAAQPERIQVGQISAEVLPLLGIEPAIGRTITPEDDSPDSARVVLLSHGLWQQGFGGDPDVLGRSLDLEGIEHTVIGIMPPEFAYPSQTTRAWVPFRLDPDDLWERNNHYFRAIGRLRDGDSMEAARSELEVLTARLNAEYPEFYGDTGFRLEVTGMLDSVVGDTRTPLLLLFGAVVFVLLVACANVANLLLARAETRRREIAMRSALGGGKGAIVRQFLIESLLLALVGGAAGIALAAWGIGFLLGIASDAIPRAENVGIDSSVLIFALAVSIVVSVLSGLLPALHVVSGDVQAVLKESGRAQAGSARGRRSRSVLVLAEVALASVLLVGGGVLMRSFINLRAVDPGFDPGHVLTARLALPETEYEEPAEVVAYYERVIEAVDTLPGVEAVGAVARLPLARGVNNWSLQIEGKVVENTADAPVAAIQQATPGYFEVMRLKLLSGRFFTTADRADARGVAIVSESFAELYWSGEEAVGQRVKVFLEDWPWLEVVGVVADVKQHGLDRAPEPKVYFPHAQSFQTAYVSPDSMHLVIRTAGDPAALVSAMRERVWSVNSAVPFGLVAPMEEVLADSIATERFVVALLSAFSAVALFLSAVGIAGIIAYSVSERTREIGIRVALGAKRLDVLRLVVLPPMALTLVGVAIGVLASTMLTGVIEGMLFETSATDPGVYAVIAAVFVACALAACYAPARRASRVDPVISLRAE